MSCVKQTAQVYAAAMRSYVKVLWPDIIRPHRSTTFLDAAYCYRSSSVVCQSVGRSVTLVSPAKTAAPIEMPFGLRTPVGPRNHVLDGVQIPHGKGPFCGGKGRPIIKYRDTLWSSVQKRPNRSRCRLDCELGWAQGIMCWMGVHRCWGTLPWQPIWDAVCYNWLCGL